MLHEEIAQSNADIMCLQVSNWPLGQVIMNSEFSLTVHTRKLIAWINWFHSSTAGDMLIHLRVDQKNCMVA